MLQRSIFRSRVLACSITRRPCTKFEPVLCRTSKVPAHSRILSSPSSRLFASTSHKTPLKRFYKSPIFGIPVILLLGYLSYDYIASFSTQPINPDTFTHFAVTSTTPLSSTSGVITLSPKSNSNIPSSFWSDIRNAGIWSVQIKQPQLQIQREYTPIPSQDPQSQDEIRIFVRIVPGGEVSPYLLSRKIGDSVEIRGPVMSYTWPGSDSSSREAIGDVLYIAGGTGISPALQVAQHMLKQDDGNQRTLTVLYASRSSQEIVLPDVKLLEKVQSSNLKINIEYFYDDQSSFITKAEIEAATAIFGINNRDKGTRDLIMVSGPEGFVNHYAGRKGWKDGIETQGVLGGVVGEILKKRKQGGSIEVMKL